MAPPAAVLTSGTKIGRYEIIDMIGAGGMGQVYRGRDPHIGRDVAIKVLPGSFAAEPDRVRRFEQEARAAGVLNHPNLLTLHDVGYLDVGEGRTGAPFLVTELLEGTTLRTRLEAGPVSIDETLAWGIQVAKGLTAAHAKGIVHRDLKPENLFLTDHGLVKILDFGLAKLTLPEADNLSTRAALTESGVFLGTVGYMAPEQVRGQNVDSRTDIFAFGAVLYELLSGQRAFQGASAADTISAILNQQPPPLSARVSGLPADVDAIVRRCLEKTRDQRYASTEALVAALQAVPANTVTLSATAAAPATAEWSRPWRKIAVAVAGVVLVAAVATGGSWFMRSPPTAGTASAALDDGRRVVAVLPFKNISADPTKDYFSVGMTEEIRGQLSKVAALRVLSRGAVDSYADGDMKRIAAELDAGSVVEGSVRLDKTRVRIDVQLVNARNGQAVWSDQYDRDLNDIFAVQSDVAARIIEALNATLSAAERQRIEKAPTGNVAAYELYLQSQQLSMSNVEANTKAIEMLRQAVDMDPKFAAAQARMSYRTFFLGTYGDATFLDSAIAQAEKALQIDPALSTAHLTIASVYGAQGRLSESRRAFFRAIEFDPSQAAAMHNLSLVELDLGRYDDALMWARRAILLTPNSRASYYHVGVTMLLLGDDDATRSWLTQTDARFPGYPRNEILRLMQDYLIGNEGDAVARSRRLVERTKGNEETRTLLADLLYLTEAPDALAVTAEQVKQAPDLTALVWLAGQSARARHGFFLLGTGATSEAQRLLDAALTLAHQSLREGNQSSRVPLEIASVHAVRQETSEALQWLERAYQAGYREYRTLSRDPMLRPLRGQPAFDAMLKRMEQDVAGMRSRANIRETLPVPLKKV